MLVVGVGVMVVVVVGMVGRWRRERWKKLVEMEGGGGGRPRHGPWLRLLLVAVGIKKEEKNNEGERKRRGYI